MSALAEDENYESIIIIGSQTVSSIYLRRVQRNLVADISGWDSEHSSTHVHCPRCGKIIARYVK